MSTLLMPLRKKKIPEKKKTELKMNTISMAMLERCPAVCPAVVDLWWDPVEMKIIHHVLRCDSHVLRAIRSSVSAGWLAAGRPVFLCPFSSPGLNADGINAVDGSAL